MNIAIMCSGNGSNFENLFHNLPPEDDIMVMIYNKKGCGAVERANRLGVPDCYMDSKDELSIMEYFRELKVELVCLCGWMRIISDELLRLYPIINVHPSLLPKYKGLNVVQRAMDAGEEYAGATVHWVNEYLDGGEIIRQGKVKIDGTDSVETLTEKIHIVEYKIYLEAIQDVKQQLSINVG